MTDRTLIFVDGENLSIRYQEMQKAGREPAPDNIVMGDRFVWNNRVLQDHKWNIGRLAYYTSITGDDEAVRELRRSIGGVTYKCVQDQTADSVHTTTLQIVPFVHKKSAKSRKESICDIAIAVDVMRACYRDHSDAIWVFSGDGDFLNLFREVLHTGKRLYVSAFSSGLSEEVKYAVDEFFILDKYFFREPGKEIPATRYGKYLK
jgi:uncharacterized LabA/DUF88 family protein